MAGEGNNNGGSLWLFWTPIMWILQAPTVPWLAVRARQSASTRNIPEKVSGPWEAADELQFFDKKKTLLASPVLLSIIRAAESIRATFLWGTIFPAGRFRKKILTRRMRREARTHVCFVIFNTDFFLSRMACS